MRRDVDSGNAASSHQNPLGGYDRAVLERPLRDAHNVLVIDRSSSIAGRKLVRSNILDESLRRKNVLHITADDSVQTLMTEWYRSRGTFPDRLAIISAAGSPHSTNPISEPGSFIRYPCFVTLDDPYDLEALGASTVSLFQRWEPTRVPTDIDFSAVSELLAHCDHRSVFHFLHLFTQWVERIEGIGWYYLVSDASMRPVENLLRELFDVVVDVDERGTFTFETG